MAARLKLFSPRTITISGKGFEICMADFRVKPVNKRRRGYGEQYTYQIDNRKDWDQFVDHFLDKAADFADIHGGDHPTYLQLVKDSSHFS